MTDYIPVELLKSPNAVNVLSMIDVVSHIIPQENPTNFVSNLNRKRMTRYNIQMLERDLDSDDTYDSQLKKFMLIKNYRDNLDKTRKEYMMCYKNKNQNYERLGTNKIIKGVGSNGGGFFPDNRSKENEAVSIIESDVARHGKWPIIGSTNNNNNEQNKEANILRQSIRGIITWPSSNIGNLSLGSPCQMISAIIGFTNNPAMTISGKEFLKLRPECEGLKYLLDGNNFDMDNGYNGVSIFESTSFRNFFNATGITGANYIVLKCGAGISTINSDGSAFTIGRTPIGTVLKENELPQTSLESTIILSHKPTEPLLFHYDADITSHSVLIQNQRTKNTGMKNALMYMFSQTDDNSFTRKCRFSSIMLIYSMFYMYAMYIYRLYEKMINDLKLNNELKERYAIANKNMRDSLLDYVNFMINKKLKINLKNPKDLIIVSTTEKVSWDTSKKSVEEIPDNELIPDHTIPATKGTPSHPRQHRYQTYLDEKDKKTAMDSITLTELKQTVYVGFKDSTLYTDPNNFVSTGDFFTQDNYPIVFLDYSTCDKIDYIKTYKRLYEFLSIGEEDEEPKIDDKIISLGAPLQNEDMLVNLMRVLDTYYSTVSNSRDTFISYMDLKLNIFKSSVSSKTVAKIRDDLLRDLGLINMVSQKELRDVKLVELAKKVKAKYEAYRRNELKLTDDKTIYKTRNSVKNTNLAAFIKEQSRVMKKLKQGTYAIIQLEVAKLTHQLFLNKNPTSALGNVFINTLNSDAKEVDDEMDKELRQLIARKTNNIAQKYGVNALKHTANIHLLRFSDIPKTPATYLSSIHSLYTSLSRGSSRVPSGIIGGPASGRSHPFQKSILTSEQTIRVSTTQFWKDMKLSFNGKTLYLPTIKISTSKGISVFNDNNFYMIDVLNSMIQARLIVIKLYPLNKKTIYARLNRTGYLMLTAITEDLSNPDRWMTIDFRHFARMLKNDGSMRFRRTAQGRSDFFNLLANNGYLISMMNNSIPAVSLTSKVLTAYCSKILKKDLNQCSLFISQPQFAQNVQQRMDMFESTKGIDLMSGYSFYEYSVVGVLNTIQR
jgi:hypothetical protein